MGSDPNIPKYQLRAPCPVRMIVRKDKKLSRVIMGRFFLNLLKFILAIILLAVLGLAIYTMFFDPKTQVREVSEDVTLTQ